MSWDFSTEPEFEKKLEWMRGFVREEVYPLEVLDTDEAGFMRAIRPLQAEVKKQKLWATHLPPDLGGQGYGQVKLGLMHEIEGATVWAPIIFGNQAPDSGSAARVSSSPRRAWGRAVSTTACDGWARRDARSTCFASARCSARPSARSSPATRRCRTGSPTPLPRCRPRA